MAEETQSGVVVYKAKSPTGYAFGPQPEQPGEEIVPGMPEEFKGHPKLELLWKYGDGMLSDREMELTEKAFSLGKLKWSRDDSAAWEKYLKRTSLDFSSARFSEDDLPEEAEYQGVQDMRPDSPILGAMRDLSIFTFGLIGSIGGGLISGGAGAAGGGSIGAATGSAVFDVTENATRAVMNGLLGTSTPMTPAQTILKDAAFEGALDAATAGIGSAMPLVGKRIKQAVLGQSTAGQAIAGAAKRLGIDVLPFQVSTSAIIRGWPTVIGRLPWLGKPITSAAKRQAEQVNSFLNSLPGRISNRIPSDMQVGLDLSKEIATFEKEFTNLSTKQAMVKQLGDTLGAAIDLTDTRMLTVKWLRIASLKGDKRSVRGMQNILKQINKSGNVTLEEWDKVMKVIQKNLDSFPEHSISRVASMELLESARADMIATPRLGKKQLALDNQWEAFLTKYEGVAASKYETAGIEKYAREIIAMSNKNPDALTGMFSSTTSAKFVSNVRKLVGFDKMQELSARYIDRAIKTSVNVDAANKSLFNPDAFAKKLGLDDINSKKFLVTQEMLRGSPVTIKMLTDFVQVAKIAAASEIPEVSKFLARRVVLAGTYAGISALALQQFGTEGGILTPIVLALMARKGSRIISNPENVRLASMALDFNANQVVRRAALIRLVGLVYRDEEGEQQLELNNPMLRMLTPDLAPDTSFGMDPMEQLRNRFSEPEG